MKQKQRNPQTQVALLDAAMQLMLEQGYNATSVEEICRAAGVTKGSFFYYFDNKEAMGHLLLMHFMQRMGELLAQGQHRQIVDPLQRIYGYCDDIVAMLADPSIPKSCLIGNFAQELAPTEPQIATICQQCIAQWAEALQCDLDAACEQYPPQTAFDSYHLAEHFITIFEGALILAKAQQDLAVVEQQFAHFKQYVALLFGISQQNVRH